MTALHCGAIPVAYTMKMPSAKLTTAAALLVTSCAFAGEKALLHCFAFTSIKEATPADWAAFYKASDALPKEIKGITHVWYGKLQSPLGIAQIGKVDDESIKKYRAGSEIMAPVTRTPRDYGVCMEMKNAEVKKAYDTHPYHKVWTEAYEKVRVDGTTTFQILGQ